MVILCSVCQQAAGPAAFWAHRCSTHLERRAYCGVATSTVSWWGRLPLCMEEKNKIMFLVFLSLSSLSQTTRKLCDRSNRKVSLHPFQVLGRAFSSGNIPQMGLSIGPNKRCHIFCPLPGFLRANMALNIACCHVTSNCHPAQLRNANHCKPKCWPVIPLIYWGANDTDICILVCCCLCHSLLRRGKNRYISCL